MARKVEIAELGKDLPKENEARKEAIDKLEAFVKSASVSAVGELSYGYKLYNESL